MSILYFAILYWLVCTALLIPALIVTPNIDNCLQTVAVYLFAPFVLVLWFFRSHPKKAAVAVGLVIGVMLTGCDSYDHAVEESQFYCQMVSLHKRTDGRDGWPAYRGERECGVVQ